MQLSASYATGQKSTARYKAGYEAAAKYLNCGADEIGGEL